MASNPSIFRQMGMEAMNYGYFMSDNIIGSGRDMMGADVTPFHPTMLLEHDFGLDCAAVTVAELGAQFATSNATLASFAGHLSAAQPQDERLGGPRTPPPEEMECGFDVAGGDSCSAASMPCHGQSVGTTIWSSSSKAAAYGSWNSGSAEPYLGGIPDAAGFRFPLAAAACGPSAPATSELSLILCSESSSGSALNAAADQCSSPRASRSALTELPHASYSRYAAVAQEVLNDVVGRLLDGVAADSGSIIDSWSVDAPSVVSSNRLLEDGGARWGEAQRGRSDLLEMLQTLDDKYSRCLDEVRSTTAKFNTLMQQGGASIRAPFAHRAVAAMYRGLRRRIMAAANGRPACWGESSSSATAGDMERSLESALIQKHWASRKARRGEQPCCWRPQRGLPERSVAVLKAWMFEHFLKPYPDDQVKDVLAARSGLSRNQVSNWFINARVRIWKPMIEEMYKDLKRTSIGWRAGDGSGAAAEYEQGNMLAA